MVATVDHGLRPESKAEAFSVGALCSARGIPHDILQVQLAPGAAVQERAREARYAALGDWAARNGLSGVATAHHADDQAETLIMRLSRGAGVRGLAAMRNRSLLPGRPDCMLLRPLLGWRQSELGEIVEAAGIEPVSDPSNSDLRFERSRVRACLLGLPDFDTLAVAASARHLAEADAAIEWAAERSFASVQSSGAALLWSPYDAPRVVALRVLERILAALGGSVPRGNALARWHDRLAAGEIATLAGIRGNGRKMEWHFEPAPPPRSPPASASGGPKG